ncbi:MAG: CocE/NonD family hydrolase [Aliifodinibius sp.]|nr:CocE/NonD family hydrolase [Fodinibius sp.]NIV16318.1 CocE/NonD family hydrolase [Fodinibius sp.]NIY30285.1 CocE/NonD family hydrolase [Fodinibius sp.]
MIPMQDGIQLATDLYFPSEADNSYPAILIRTPYNKNFLEEYGIYYSMRGYVVAIQDVRGRFSSEGDWVPFLNEGQDGYDSVEWLAAQGWCTGKIGMLGGSYSGSVQFLTAIKRPPHLSTIIPNIAPAMPFENLPYDGGVLLLGWGIRWVDLVENARTGLELQQKLMASIRNDWFTPLLDLPVIDLDRKIVGKEIAYWRDWIQHNTHDSYWEPLNYLEELASLDLPVFLQSGWFDNGNRGTKLAYAQLKKGGNPNVRMIIGPWSHSDRGGRYLEGQDMGPEADINMFDLYRNWFDFWLKNADNKIMDEPPVQCYLMRSNYWLRGNKYPLTNTSLRNYYLDSESNTAGQVTKGILRPALPDDSNSYDSFSYNPASPTPSVYAYLKRNQLEQYQHQIASRNDVLIYETPVLKKALAIAGPISLVLYASSSAKDTDWSATLYGLNEMNEPYPLGMTFGMVRARFRSSRSVPVLLEPGQIYEYIIDLSHTAVTMPVGHRLRLEIASASFPEYSRNLNTGGHNEMDSTYVVADQKIYHSRQFPSHLVLPVINPDDFK